MSKTIFLQTYGWQMNEWDPEQKFEAGLIVLESTSFL